MSSTIEVLGNNKVNITLNISAEKFDQEINNAYKSEKNKINLPGFRKGRAPRKLLEAQFGKDLFYEDAVNALLPEVYEEAVLEHDLDVVSRPVINIIEADHGKGAVVSAEVTVKPPVNVDGYLGIEYEKVSTDVSDEEINEEIDTVREKNARFIPVTDRALENGDIAVIDFTGYVDEEAFEGGQGTDYELTIGSGAFIPGFEEQLIGANAGDNVKVNVTFPEEYRAEHLKGKPAVFDVTVKNFRIKELPDANDEFAQDVSEFDTLEEYKNDIRAKISMAKERQVEHERGDRIVNELINRTTVDIPDVMIDIEADSIAQNFARRLSAQGLPLESYLEYTGTRYEDLVESCKENARKNVIARLALETVAKNENIEVSDEEVDDEILSMAKSYGVDNEKLKERMSGSEIRAIKMDLKVQKALKIVEESAVEKSAH